MSIKTMILRPLGLVKRSDVVTSDRLQGSSDACVTDDILWRDVNVEDIFATDFYFANVPDDILWRDVNVEDIFATDFYFANVPDETGILQTKDNKYIINDFFQLQSTKRSSRRARDWQSPKQDRVNGTTRHGQSISAIDYAMSNIPEEAEVYINKTELYNEN